MEKTLLKIIEKLEKLIENLKERDKILTKVIYKYYPTVSASKEQKGRLFELDSLTLNLESELASLKEEMGKEKEKGLYPIILDLSPDEKLNNYEIYSGIKPIDVQINGKSLKGFVANIELWESASQKTSTRYGQLIVVDPSNV